MGSLLTLGGGPSADLALETDTDDLGALKLPGNVGHDVDSVGSSNTAGNHAETSGVRGVRVGSDHETSGEGVVLEDDLVDDTRSGLPEAHTVLGGSGGEEVVDLAVEVVGTGEVLDSADLGLDEVVAVDGRRDGSLGKTGRHELEDGHLGGGVLAGDALWKTRRGARERTGRSEKSEKGSGTRRVSLDARGGATHVRAKLKV